MDVSVFDGSKVQTGRSCITWHARASAGRLRKCYWSQSQLNRQIAVSYTQVTRGHFALNACQCLSHGKMRSGFDNKKEWRYLCFHKRLVVCFSFRRTDLNSVLLTSKKPPRLICDGFISVALRNMLTSVWASAFIQDSSTIRSFFWKFVRTWEIKHNRMK